MVVKTNDERTPSVCLVWRWNRPLLADKFVTGERQQPLPHSVNYLPIVIPKQKLQYWYQELQSKIKKHSFTYIFFVGRFWSSETSESNVCARRNARWTLFTGIMFSSLLKRVCMCEESITTWRSYRFLLLPIYKREYTLLSIFNDKDAFL